MIRRDRLMPNASRASAPARARIVNDYSIAARHRAATEENMQASMDAPDFGRRALLRSAIILLGGSAAGLPGALLAKPTRKAKRFFSAPQYALLDEVTEIILPRTDTPGARDAGVAASIDAMMTTWASTERRQQFRALLDDIDRSAVTALSKPLLRLSHGQRVEAVTAYDKAHAARDPVYRAFKHLVLTAYFLSEAGATKELRYEHTPGRWEPLLRVTPETRAWAV